MNKEVRQYRNAVTETLMVASQKLAQHLADHSPVGASPQGQSLRAGWRVVSPRLPENLGGVVNVTPDAKFRILGRGPGTPPPSGPGTPLDRWAKLHGIRGNAVAKAIGQSGTLRWRQGAMGNVLKQDPRSGRLSPDSPIYTVYAVALRRASESVEL